MADGRSWDASSYHRVSAVMDAQQALDRLPLAGTVTMCG
jgi:hypothetical protein